METPNLKMGSKYTTVVDINISNRRPIQPTHYRSHESCDAQMEHLLRDPFSTPPTHLTLSPVASARPPTPCPFVRIWPLAPPTPRPATCIWPLASPAPYPASFEHRRLDEEQRDMDARKLRVRSNATSSTSASSTAARLLHATLFL
jgi:hypothetical protein